MRIECIECGTVKEVAAGPGGYRFFCRSRCRMAAHLKCKADPALIEEYDAKRDVIRRQYREARRTSRSPLGLRRRAISLLRENEWSVGDLAVLFELSDTRVRQLLKKRGESDA